jgi:hypothetical protein
MQIYDHYMKSKNPSKTIYSEFNELIKGPGKGLLKRPDPQNASTKHDCQPIHLLDLVSCLFLLMLVFQIYSYIVKVLKMFSYSLRLNGLANLYYRLYKPGLIMT